MSALFELKLNPDLTWASNQKSLISRSSYGKVQFGLMCDNFVR